MDTALADGLVADLAASTDAPLLGLECECGWCAPSTATALTLWSFRDHLVAAH